MKLISEQKKTLAQFLSGAFLLAALGGCGGSEEGGSVQQAGDPLYEDQWHLKNIAQFVGARSGEDINVEPVWAGTVGNSGAVKGSGVLVAVVDDGLQLAHEDLSANIAANKSWDYADRDTDPTSSELYHGTSVAGLIAARDLNGLGVRGVAPRASLAGYNLLWNIGEGDDSDVLTTDIYDAMTRNRVEVDVSNNSWGLAIDELGEAEPPSDSLWQLGIEEGINNGRDGKGIIYVWSAGNGGSDGQDNSNYDYQTNNRHVISVCAVDGRGKQAGYSEPGANIWLCAPGGKATTSSGISTTDLMGAAGGNPDKGFVGDYKDQAYTRVFAGTSAAAPIVSGVVALMLEANPNLGWRDVRLILAETARKNDFFDNDWSVTSPMSGQPQYNINHKYGFGVVDAAAAVSKASGWINVGDQVIIEKTLSTAIDIPDNNSIGIQQSISLDAVADGDLIIEYVELDFSAGHQYSGDLEIILTAPSGTKSVLAETHDCLYLDGFGNLQTRRGTCFYDYNPWTFASGRHLGEGSAGTWKLNVVDKANAGAYGQLQSWTLRIYGRTQ